MAQDSLTLYKLIILYMLDRAAFPLTKAQVYDFILDKEYTNFLTLQQAVSELTDTGLATAESNLNRTYLRITGEGKETLSFFGNRVNDSIRQDIDTFFAENGLEMRNEISIAANYYKTTYGEYEAYLQAKEKDVPLVEITLSVPDESTAAAICSSWQKKNQDIYQYLISQLF